MFKGEVALQMEGKSVLLSLVQNTAISHVILAGRSKEQGYRFILVFVGDKLTAKYSPETSLTLYL